MMTSLSKKKKQVYNLKPGSGIEKPSTPSLAQLSPHRLPQTICTCSSATSAVKSRSCENNKNHIQQATFISAMMEFLTAGYNGYAVKYSPFVNDRLAVATSANFGLVGNGRLYILGLTANGIVLLKQ
jgi:hypothetical protein